MSPLGFTIFKSSKCRHQCREAFRFIRSIYNVVCGIKIATIRITERRRDESRENKRGPTTMNTNLRHSNSGSEEALSSISRTTISDWCSNLPLFHHYIIVIDIVFNYRARFANSSPANQSIRSGMRETKFLYLSGAHSDILERAFVQSEIV